MIKENEEICNQISARSIIVASRVKAIVFKCYERPKYVPKIKNYLLFNEVGNKFSGKRPSVFLCNSSIQLNIDVPIFVWIRHCKFHKFLLVKTIFFLNVPDWDERHTSSMYLNPFETIPIEMSLCV